MKEKNDYLVNLSPLETDCRVWLPNIEPSTLKRIYRNDNCFTVFHKEIINNSEELSLGAYCLSGAKDIVPLEKCGDKPILSDYAITDGGSLKILTVEIEEGEEFFIIQKKTKNDPITKEKSTQTVLLFDENMEDSFISKVSTIFSEKYKIKNIIIISDGWTVFYVDEYKDALREHNTFLF